MVGGPGSNFQLLILSPNLLKFKIPCSVYVCVWRGGGGGLGPNFLLFDPEYKFSKIPYFLYGRGSRTQLPTFDPEYKSFKIQNSLYGMNTNLLKSKIPYMGGGGGLRPNLQLFILSPNLLKSKIPQVVWGRGRSRTQFPTFDPEYKSSEIQNSLYGRGGAGPNVQFLILSTNLLKSKIRYVVGWVG